MQHVSQSNAIGGVGARAAQAAGALPTGPCHAHPRDQQSFRHTEVSSKARLQAQRNALTKDSVPVERPVFLSDSFPFCPVYTVFCRPPTRQRSFIVPKKEFRARRCGSRSPRATWPVRDGRLGAGAKEAVADVRKHAAAARLLLLVRVRSRCRVLHRLLLRNPERVPAQVVGEKVPGAAVPTLATLVPEVEVVRSRGVRRSPRRLRRRKISCTSVRSRSRVIRRRAGERWRAHRAH